MLRIANDALTFDDVLLLPAYSDVLPSEALLETRLTRNITLNIPLMSAAMDTVTEGRLAIAMAQEGGIGIVHKNLGIEAQARQVRMVKKFESGIIRDPITIHPDRTVADLFELTLEHKISGVPVVEGTQLVGIVTSRDIRFERRMDAKIREVMTPKEQLLTAREDASFEEITSILHKHRIEKVLLINDRFELKGMVTVKDINKARAFPNACKDAKSRYPGVAVIGGNVATAEGARALIDAGVDAVKVGIGPGSICTTRIVTGIGVPQITAIGEAVKVAGPAGIPVIADGGIRYSGDIAKAIVAGASVVMVGGLLAGTDEAPGEVELYQGRTYKAYRGMGSIGAMGEAHGSSDRYFQDLESDTRKLVPEGIEGRVPYRGPVGPIVHQLMGGLRAAMGYTGSPDIATMRTRPEFVRVSHASMIESHVHDVSITKEAPNYPRG